MEVKKSQKADLENKKAMFVQIGLVLALSLCIFAFEYKSYDKKESVMQDRQVVQEVEEVVIATQQNEPPPPPEDVPAPETTEFEIVDDNQKLENEFNVSNFAATTNVAAVATQIEINTEEVEEEEVKIFTIVEQEASFPGGYEALMKHLAENIKYPQQARETGTKGRVFLTFVVERDGSITDIKILRDIGSGCGEEAKRVVSKMPRWQPAKQRGKPVRQQFNLPVNFNLQGS